MLMLSCVNLIRNGAVLKHRSKDAVIRGNLTANSEAGRAKMKRRASRWRGFVIFGRSTSKMRTENAKRTSNEVQRLRFSSIFYV
jgi:hypothetical protein